MVATAVWKECRGLLRAFLAECELLIALERETPAASGTWRDLEAGQRIGGGD